MWLHLGIVFAFVGRRAMLFGAFGILAGFMTFLFDIGLAMSLQRFLTATGLIDQSGALPLGLSLMAPSSEAMVLIACGILRGVAAWANGYFTGICQTTVEAEKRTAVAAWALSSGHESTGRVMTLFNDVMVGAAANISNTFYVLSRLVLFSGLTVMMSIYSIWLTGVVFLFILIAAPLQRLIDVAVSGNARKIQTSLAGAMDLLAIAIKNGLFISLHDMARSETERVQNRVDQYGQASMRYYALAAFRSVIPQTLGLIAVCLIAIQGAESFADGRGALVAYLYLVLRLFQILSDLARASGNMRLNAPRLKVLWHWWRDNVHQTTPANMPSSHVAVGPVGWSARNLSFSWNRDVITSIQNLNFSISPGQIVLISGPSGTGKTSLMYLLMGLVAPTSGELLWIAQGQTRPLTGRLPARIAYVGSEPFIIPGTVRDQLLAGQGRVIEDVELHDALRAARADFVFGMPGGLDYVLSEQGIGLSAGQKQRLALARALLRQPSVLLLDEATANLDPETEHDVLETIKAMHRNVTVLVISHRPHPTLAPDQTIILQQDA